MINFDFPGGREGSAPLPPLQNAHAINYLKFIKAK